MMQRLRYWKINSIEGVWIFLLKSSKIVQKGVYQCKLNGRNLVSEENQILER